MHRHYSSVCLLSLLEATQSKFTVSGPTSYLKMTRPPFFSFWKPKWKENGVQTAKCIVEGEVWGTRLQNADNCVSKEPKYVVKSLSAGCVNTVVAC